MGRMYTVSFAPVSVSAQVDLWELVPADDKPCCLHGLKLGQQGISDVGDVQEELLGLEVRRAGTALTSGSVGGTAVTAAVNPGDTGASFAAEVLNSTLATLTGGGLVDYDSFNVRSPYSWFWTPETRPVVTQANGGLVIRLSAAPADAIVIGGTLYVEETG